METTDPTRLIIEAWRQGRPIVPFIGAGVSIGAGFPNTSRLIAYFAKVRYTLDHEIFKSRYPIVSEGVETTEEMYKRRPSEFIADFGWPDVAQLNADMWQWILDRPRDIETPEHAVQQVLLQRLNDTEGLLASFLAKATEAPPKLHGDWTSLLNHLSEGQFDLIDALFSSLNMGRRPTRAHVFLAFLTQLMGVRLILTVNFDTLLEEALNAEGLHPRIFDINRDADLPHAALVRKQFSVVKLHGSAYGLRLGERVQYSLEEEARKRIRGYVPDDALLVVIGFSGWERRMMDVIADFARRGASKSSHTQVLWITAEPREATHSPQLLSIETDLTNQGLGRALELAFISDASLFLPDLYFQVASTFPASARSYQALIPRPTVRIEKEESSQTLKVDAPSLVVLSDRPLERTAIRADDSVASSWPTLAASELASMRRDRHVVWVDIENHHTIEGIVRDILDQIREVDPRAPYLVLPAEPEPTLPGSYDLTKPVERIREAFQRGDYILVLDSLEAFARPELVHHGVPRWNKGTPPYVDFVRKLKRFTEFVGLLLGVGPDRTPIEPTINDAIVVLTVTAPGTRHLEGEPQLQNAYKLAIDDELEELLDRRLAAENVAKAMARPGKPLLRIDLPFAKADGLAAQWCRRYQLADLPCSVRGRIAEIEKKRSQGKLDALVDLLRIPAVLRRRLEEPGEAPFEDPDDAFALVAFLSVFRRQRPLPVLRAYLGRWLFDPGELETPRMLTDAYETLDRAFQAIEEGGLCRMHEGKSLWMPRDVHQAVYEALTGHLRHRTLGDLWEEQSCGAGSIVLIGLFVSTLHLQAARVYYSDVYWPSHDEQAFCEYVYHRVSGLRYLALVQATLEECLNHTEQFDSQLTRIDSKLKEVDGQHVFASVNPPRQGSGVDNSRAILGALTASWPVIGRCLEMIGPLSFVRRDRDLNRHLNVALGISWPRDDRSPKNVVDIVKALLLAVHSSREHSLVTLQKAFMRARGRIQSTTTPETWLGWIDQLQEYEAAAITGNWTEMEAMGRVPRGFPLKNCTGRSRHRPDSFSQGWELFEYLLVETKFKLLRKNLDFRRAEAAACARLAQLSSRLSRKGSEAQLLTELEMWCRLEAPSQPPRAWKLTIGALQTPKSRAGVTKDMMRHLLRCWIELTRSMAGSDGARPHADLLLRALISRKDINAVEPSGVLRSVQYDCNLLQNELQLASIPMWRYFDKTARGFTVPSTRLSILQDVERGTHELEDLVREESERSSDYAVRKSRSLVLRARALYLRSQFREAHRVLNHALCDLQGGGGRHKLAQAVVHLFRAELLAISAHVHLEQGRLIAGSIRKIETGLELLDSAGTLLEPAGERPLWWLRLHVGRAQLRHEQILYELSRLGEGDWPTSWTFAQRSLWLEQAVLDGLGSLRIALDTLPFREDPFGASPGDPLIAIEQKILALWVQLLVVAFAHNHVMAVKLQMPKLVSPQPETFGWFEYYSWTTGIINTLGRKRVRGLAMLLRPQGFWDQKWRPWCKSRQFHLFAADPGQLVSGNEKTFVTRMKELSNQTAASTTYGARRSIRDDILMIEENLIMKDRVHARLWEARRRRKWMTRSGSGD